MIKNFCDICDEEISKSFSQYDMSIVFNTSLSEKKIKDIQYPDVCRSCQSKFHKAIFSTIKRIQRTANKRRAK